MTDRDLVDRIDRLVHDQLAHHDNRSGYDSNVNQALCPHCGREWHGLAITERMQQMRHARALDPTYSYVRDHSRVHFLDTGREPNAFAVALRAYAAHIASAHDPVADDRDDASAFSARWALPTRGVLWDSRHTVIGRFGPGGSAFEPGATARDLRGFGGPPPTRA
ncbi:MULTISPECIES: hypothetical protein [Rhodococcus]|uniref:Uncharacterized protein n=1 Tax=Rhodococcus opacus TaxID=37919 RepID=A0A076EKM7_RHOOP|nr:hypothetical protein [Rhodococcus opacus]AII06256.1 hypothetical protein EP51_17235 [Rhodococcus opacus]